MPGRLMSINTTSGSDLRNFLQRRFAVGIFADELVAGRAFDQRRQTAADSFIIIHDGDFDLHKIFGAV